MGKHSLLAFALALAACGGAKMGPAATPPPSEATPTVEAGWTAPDFALADYKGEHFQLHRALDQGPVVLVFYRGHW